MKSAVLGLVIMLPLSCVAQNPARCSPELPRYAQWSAAQHFPVVLDPQSQQALAAKLARVALGMSMDQVRALAGPPTYVADGTLQPHAVACVWGYSFEDSGPAEPIGAKHRVIVGFAQDGTVAAIVPQRVEGIQLSQVQDRSCEADSPNPAAALSQAVAAGKPYVADNLRQAEVRSGYPALSLGMSIRQVENLLGKADWQVAKPHPHPPQVWVAGEPCGHELAYIFRLEGNNLEDPKTVGIYLSFDDKGGLVRATPQNLEGLKTMGSLPREGTAR